MDGPPSSSTSFSISSSYAKAHANFNIDHYRLFTRAEQVVVKLDSPFFKSNDDRGAAKLEKTDLVAFRNGGSGVLVLLVDAAAND